MDTTKTTTHVSLCAGYGGIDLGLSRAIPNLRTVAFSEIEAFACANLVAKMETGLLDAAPIWTNLKTFPWSEFRDRVDILSGGYPCQPFSAAGKRLGTEDPRHLWPFIAAGIVSMRPRVCFFENVEGHISLGLREVVGELESIGYQTAWGIFSASEVGAPHQRKRVFILAHRKNIGIQGDRPIWLEESRPHAGQALSVRGGDAGGRELADAVCNGSGESWPVQQGPDGTKPISDGESWGTWPSRPGQPQHGWEPPRVVGNAQHDGSHQCDTQTRGAESCGEQGWVQESEGGSASVGDTESIRSSTRRPEHERLGRELCTTGTGCEGVVGNATSEGSQERPPRPHDSPIQATQRGSGSEGNRQTESTLGRDADGAADWLDDAELFVTSDNRTDELRLLGNGVVPATATRAFLVLMDQLLNETP